jgi:hypothetical protein
LAQGKEEGKLVCMPVEGKAEGIPVCKLAEGMPVCKLAEGKLAEGIPVCKLARMLALEGKPAGKQVCKVEGKALERKQEHKVLRMDSLGRVCHRSICCPNNPLRKVLRLPR